MKVLISFLFFTGIVFAQTPNPSLQAQMNFEPGELIVKLKDDVDAAVTYSRSGKASSDFKIGELLGIADKLSSSKVMFHKKAIEQSIINKEATRARNIAKALANPNNGYKPQEPMSMKNVFVLETTDTQENILQLIEQIKDNPSVEYAEPNYIYGIDDFEVGDIITAEEASKLEANTLVDVDDPLYSSQSNITTTNIDDVWDQYTTGDGSQVIAILDTGGDYTHPDLEANTWINEAELNGVEGYDDDGNGYIDDIRGWDFINLDNAPLDDNMHGTHVAGIIGAVGNNGIGIAGAAWDVKLMHIKVFQSTGRGNSTNIAAGVEYASENGATIINMSFGSYAESFTLKSALENAYATSLLVGAAGNNKICIGPGTCPDFRLSAPMYPGAYNYVLGVEDSNGNYDNYDQDGPVVTRYSNLLNYELKAPGSSIMSTIPGGGYATLTGTSMATPLVAGGMALYNQIKPDDSNELIFGTLINTSQSSVDILAAIEATPTPQLAVLSAITRDTIGGQNGNDFIEPGETIEILPLIRNYWGPSEDVRVGIAFAEFEDTSKATIIQDEIQIGSISAYATLQDLEESLKITISEGVANNVDIRFNLTVWSGPNQEYMSEPTEIILNVKNGIILDSYITSDLVLLEDNEYTFVNSLILSGDTTLTIEPGVTINMSDNSRIIIGPNATLNANGTNNKPIIIKASNIGWGGVQDQGPGSTGGDDGIYESKFYFTKFYNIDQIGIYDTPLYGDILFQDCEFLLSNFRWDRLDRYCTFKRCNFYDNYLGSAVGSSFEDINVIRNSVGDRHSQGGIGWMIRSSWDNRCSFFNNFCVDSPGLISPEHYNLKAGGVPVLQDISVNNYFGSISQDILSNSIIDFYTNPLVFGTFDYNTVAQVPFETSHGIVWKVLVNNKDAQDEYHLLDPLGVGTHEFKVYFNRSMDTSVNPQVSYGVTIPFTQKTITEEGTWSSDGKIYTVNHEIGIGAADGINRIRVQDAQDLDYFKIPVEDYRFNFLLQSAGSASAGWFATPGLGKIDLEWVAPSSDVLDDVLGYNMYRYQIDVDGNESDVVKLNESLIIEDTDDSTTGVYFTDFDVEQEQTYFYKYKILRTSFEETDYSSTVSSVPLTSELGDSNGDFDVNVMDLVHDVDYINGNNPSPFIFVAADVNNDETINVLDIVGTVELIQNPGGESGRQPTGSINYFSNNSIGDAVFTWEGNDLYVTSDFDIGGIQLAFDKDFIYSISDDLSNIERLDYLQDNAKVVMLYSFNNNIIANTKTKILTRSDQESEFDIENAVVGTTQGDKLNAILNKESLESII
jgi:subtilisin family serine protease